MKSQSSGDQGKGGFDGGNREVTGQAVAVSCDMGFKVRWEWISPGTLEGSLEIEQAGTVREGVPGREDSSCKGMEAC